MSRHPAVKLFGLNAARGSTTVLRRQSHTVYGNASRFAACAPLLLALGTAACGASSEPAESLSAELSVQDVTAAGSAIALITAPTGGGNHDIQVIRDGVMPAVGSSDSSTQYDTYAGGGARAEDWIGYTFPSSQNFSQVVFQEGKQFSDGGWFTTLKVQIHESGAWVDVAGASTSPAYPANNGVNFETFTFTFPPVVGDGIRIDGAPGGSAQFISVGELRVFASTTAANTAPTANAGQNATVTSGSTLTLDASGSSDPAGKPLTYAWSQTAGPALTLSSTTAATPSFVAPTVSTSTALTFSLVVNDGTMSSAAASVTVTVSPPTPQGTAPASQDVTAAGTPIALITAPTGGGNHDIQVIRDGITPAVGSTDSLTQYDTYAGGGPRAEDWIGYSFGTTQSFNKLLFQEGKNFSDGGYFTTLKVQVRAAGVWVDVSGVVLSPAYSGGNGINFETFLFSFPAVAGDGIRIDGAPGGSAHFISVGELRAFSTSSTSSPPPASSPPPPAAVSYATDFNLTEMPISEGGVWQHNDSDNALVYTAGGLAYGTQSGTAGYNDSYAALTGFPPNQAASAVIHLDPNISGGTHEVEILLRFADGAHLARGYECNLAFDGSYTQIVRWDSNGFTYLSPTNGAVTGNPGHVQDGDVFSAQIVGNVITVYLNGVQINTATDSTYATGNPGMAFWRGGPSARQDDYGFTSFTAKSL